MERRIHQVKMAETKYDAAKNLTSHATHSYILLLSNQQSPIDTLNENKQFGY
jgi:hypothetical protein